MFWYVLLLVILLLVLGLVKYFYAEKESKAMEIVDLCLAIPLSCVDSVLKKKKNIKGNVVVVTGAGHGIGREISLALHKLGAKLALVDINSKACQDVADSIKDGGGVAVAFAADVSKPEEMNKLATNIENHADLGPVDILICNAGILTANLVHVLSDDDIRKSIDVNLLGYFWTVRAFLPAMLQRDRGHIVTNVSITSYIGGKYGSAYSASKFGIRGLMESLQMELIHSKSNIKTTMIHPYFVRTNLFTTALINDTSFPLLDMDDAIGQFVDAVLYETREVSIPKHMMYLTILQKLLLPYRLREALRKLVFGKESVFRPAPVRTIK